MHCAIASANEAAGIVIRQFFSEGGPLARQIQGYAPRASQARMAEAVAEALEQGGTLAVEAGTGTGKTFAYLVPALTSGRRTVISTGTLNLQDQLFYRDLPRVRAALDVPARISLLKGRANYLCRHRLEKALQQPATRREAAILQDLRAWMGRTDSGELREIRSLSDDEPLLPRVTSTAENCLGSQCPQFEDCFVVRARRNAQTADVVVVNHHLLFADFLIREEGFGQILPGAEAVIVDEAHQLPELATRFFGIRVSTRQLNELAQDVADEAAQLADVPQLKEGAAALAEATAVLEPGLSQIRGRERLETFRNAPGMTSALEGVGQTLADLAAMLQPLAGRSADVTGCAERATLLQSRLEQLTAPDRDRVAWVEASGRGGVLNSTPIRVDEDFQRLRGSHAGAWIFTSATLATDDDFSHFCDQLGLEAAQTLRLESPFDYARQARMYLPPDLPDPNSGDYSMRVAAAITPLIRASGGGAFVLCTSHRALREIAQHLRETLSLPLWVQGEGPRTELLDAFTAAGNGVLVGTASFWEGVDVRGSALRLVIIDRLPFAAPGDPVFEARLAAIREAGGEPFRDYQLPQAIMTLRQGVGRLIRDPADQGLLVLCDPRLRTRGYGRRMLAALPEMPVLDAPSEAIRWLRQLAPQAVAPSQTLGESRSA
jgi:ATP-dependent DNA helicase DinG